MGLYGANESGKPRLCFCPECGIVYYTNAENCMAFGHMPPMTVHDEPKAPVWPILVDLDAELLLK